MKKTLTTLIIGITLINFLGLISVNNTANADTQALKDQTFDVGNLKVTGDGGSQSQGYFNKSNNSPIENVVLNIIVFATKVVGSIAMILLIASGFMFMVSQGNEQNLEKAKSIGTYAVIGLIIIFLSYIITLFVQSIFITTS
ncbi:MAG: hypothetical protein WC806_03245 [Candidatus Gracilibacteria bacterium]|jgi:hypothetical protein